MTAPTPTPVPTTAPRGKRHTVLQGAGHGVKRPATFVPWWCRGELDKLSKADLMEIAYDLAVRSVGEGAGEIAAYTELRDTAGILARSAERKEPRLQRGVELAREHGRPEAESVR